MLLLVKIIVPVILGNVRIGSESVIVINTNVPLKFVYAGVSTR